MLATPPDKIKSSENSYNNNYSIYKTIICSKATNQKRPILIC